MDKIPTSEAVRNKLVTQEVEQRPDGIDDSRQQAAQQGSDKVFPVECRIDNEFLDKPGECRHSKADAAVHNAGDTQRAVLNHYDVSEDKREDRSHKEVQDFISPTEKFKNLFHNVN